MSVSPPSFLTWNCKPCSRKSCSTRVCGLCWGIFPWQTRGRHPQIQPLNGVHRDGGLEWMFIALSPSRVLRVVHMAPADVDRRWSINPGDERTNQVNRNPNCDRVDVGGRLPRYHSDSQLHSVSQESLPDDPSGLPCCYDSDSSHSSFVAAVRDERMWRKCFHHRLVPPSRPRHVFTSRLENRDGPTAAKKPASESEVNGQARVEAGVETDPTREAGGEDGEATFDVGTPVSIDGSYPNLAFQADAEATIECESGTEKATDKTDGPTGNGQGERLSSRSASLESMRRSVLSWLGQHHPPKAKDWRSRFTRHRKKKTPPETEANLDEIQTDPSPPAEEFVQISFQVPKPQRKKCLLFMIHGVGGSAETWKSQISYFLAAGYEVVAPDLLGHGFSSAPDSMKAFKFKRLLADVLHIFDRFVAQGRKAVIIGHSYGCSFASKLARLRPDGVCLLILISGGGPSPLVPPTGGLMSLPTWLLQFLQPCLWFYIRRSLLNGNTSNKGISLSQAYDIPPYVLHHVMRGQNWPEGDASFHRKIVVPVLLIYGLKDPLVSLVEMCEMERILPRAHLELLAKAGHMLMLDAPEQVNRVMHRFLLKYNRLTYSY